MISNFKRNAIVVTLLVTFIGVMAPVLFRINFGGPVSITPAEVKERLVRHEAQNRLVDIRSKAKFQEKHIAGAIHWSYDAIEKTAAQADLPEPLKGKRLYLICESGFLSVLAVGKLDALGVADAKSVEGGYQAWISSSGQPGGDGLDRMVSAGEEGTMDHYRESPLYEQWAAVLTGFVVKPFYMLLSLVLIIVLWRSKARDLVLLRWALLFFLIGESFCAINYLVFNEGSYLSEYLHSFGMVLSFGFTFAAFFEGVDLRLVRFSDPEKKCAALGLCRECIKYAKVPCGLKRSFLVIIPAVLSLCFIPWTAVPEAVAYNTTILGTFYHYSHPVVYQLFEILYCPLAAMMLLVLSLLSLTFSKDASVFWGKMLFSLGAGFLSFGLFRLFLFGAFRDNLVWFAFWEEVTELVFMVGVAVILWIFRRSLFAAKA